MTEDRTPLEYVQRAAIELIGAARSTLDILEDLVSDPPRFTGIVNQIGRLAQSVVEGFEGAPASGPRSSPPTPQKVEHIPIR